MSRFVTTISRPGQTGLDRRNMLRRPQRVLELRHRVLRETPCLFCCRPISAMIGFKKR